MILHQPHEKDDVIENYLACPPNAARPYRNFGEHFRSGRGSRFHPPETSPRDAMPLTETDVRLDLEAMLATIHTEADWIHDVARKIVWGHWATKDLVGLMDDEYVVTHQYFRDELYARGIDPETNSRRSGTGVIRHGTYASEDVPMFVEKHRNGFDWIHPKWRG